MWVAVLVAVKTTVGTIAATTTETFIFILYLTATLIEVRANIIR